MKNQGRQQQAIEGRDVLVDAVSLAAALSVVNSFKTFRRLETLVAQGFYRASVEGFTPDRWKDSPLQLCGRVEASTYHGGRIHLLKEEETTVTFGVIQRKKWKKTPPIRPFPATCEASSCLDDGRVADMRRTASVSSNNRRKDSPPQRQNAIGMVEGFTSRAQKVEENTCPHRQARKVEKIIDAASTVGMIS